MDKQKELFLKQIEQMHQINKIQGSQDYMNYIGNNYEFLINLVHEQNYQLTSHAPEGHNYTNEQYVRLLSENVEFRTQFFKYERTIEQLRNENKILIRSVEILTGSKPYFAAEREAIATRENEHI